NLLMVKSLSVMGITDSDFPMSSITGRANFLLTTSIGGGVHSGVNKRRFRNGVCILSCGFVTIITSPFPFR
ncbi:MULTISPECIES: hypothetical protein, partial [unclassified Raoultella]|uniref:hypothetical protein n=1 Tax=unclassified Raoultella TaxID=2627600 RepID=UPI001D11D20D